MKELLCDFCSEPSPTWCYPAETFIAMEVGPVASASDGGWAACEECHRLIETDDRQGLADRSVALLIVANPEFAHVSGDLRRQLGDLHQGFFDHRLGPGTPIEVSDDKLAEGRHGT